MKSKRSMRTLTSSALILALLIATPELSLADTKTVHIKALQGSGESGTATITDLPNADIKVVVQLTGIPSGSPVQPMHIHYKYCGAGGGIFKALKSPAKGQGTSTTILQKVSGKVGGQMFTGVDYLIALQTSINVHQSSSNLPDVLSCGNIKGKNL